VSPCSLSQFDCQGHCIPLLWICDKEKDCESGIDEDEEICDGVGKCMHSCHRCVSFD
jgi:hypothetical protein